MGGLLGVDAPVVFELWRWGWRILVRGSAPRGGGGGDRSTTTKSGVTTSMGERRVPPARNLRRLEYVWKRKDRISPEARKVDPSSPDVQHRALLDNLSEHPMSAKIPN